MATRKAADAPEAPPEATQTGVTVGTQAAETPEEIFYQSESAALVLGMMVSLANDFATRLRPYNPEVADWLAGEAAKYEELGGKPTVVETNPPGGSTGISRKEPLTVTFRSPISPASVTTTNFSVAVTGSGAPFDAPVSLSDDGKTVTIDPAADLPNKAALTITVLAAVQNLIGFTMGTDYTASFAT